MTQANDIIQATSKSLVVAAGKIIHADIEQIFSEESQFAGGGDAIGEPLIGATPLAPFTVRLKREQGAPFPSKPRVRTTALMNSIAEEYGEMTGVISVTDGDEQKVDYQQRTRPFIGVSERALAGIDRDIEVQGTKLVAELEKVKFEPVRITLG